MKWDIDCKRFPIADHEREQVLQCLHLCSLMANHDAATTQRDLGMETEEDHRNAVEMNMVEGSSLAAESLDAIWMFCEQTRQTDRFESVRPYLIQGLIMKLLEKSITHKICSRIAMATQTPIESIFRVYSNERKRMMEMSDACDCGVCAVTSILDYAEVQDDCPTPRASRAIQLLHEHIKGKSAIDDLLNGL